MFPAPPAHALARNLARALASSPEFRGACFARFGRDPSVFLDSTGARDWDDLYPFAVVYAASESFGRGARTLAVNVLLCIRALGDDPGSAKPVLDEAGGFFELPAAEALQDFAAGVVCAVCDSEIGAVLDDWSADWDFGSEWPEQSALLTFNYRNDFAYTHTPTQKG